VAFDYDTNHERFRQTGPNGTTIYLNPRMDLGGHFEQTTLGGVVENRHTVYAAGKAIAEVVTRDSVKQTRYFHTDQLGSIDAVTDDNAIVLARYAFDPFGARTPLYGNFGTTRHGFTGHEELPEVGLIHMNGRVYDPTLGRFLSADPSGYSWFSKFMHSTIGKVITLAAAAAVTILTVGATTAVLTSYTASLGGASLFGATITTAGVTTLTASTLGAATIGAVSGFAASFTGGFLGSGGDFNAGLKGAAYGGLLGAAGGAFSKWTTTDWNFGGNDPTKLTKEVFEKYRNINWDQIVLKVGSESLVRGSVYTIMGQDFRKGLLSVYAIIPTISTELYNAYVPWNAQTFGTGDSGAVKDYAEGVIIHQNRNDFGIDTPGSFGSTGGTFSRIMDGYIPGMSSISKIHDVWATYSPLCESNACVTTMLPAAAVTYGSLANWSPTTH
jgi:RHS repeat-associated protein